MIKLAHTQVWVHDQEEALAWYTQKLGFELRSDVTVAEMGDFRWLAVGPVGQPDVAIVLMAIPGEPVFDPETVGHIEAIMAKGAAGGIFFECDDLDARYEELAARGVEFTQEPSDTPYGRDAGFRDPSGNNFRLAQLAPVPAT